VADLPVGGGGYWGSGAGYRLGQCTELPTQNGHETHG
jgi:hypothetical protein